jgi:adenylate cyclase
VDAIHAALQMQAATKELMTRRAEQKQETFEIGIGINTGNAIIGNVGSQNRMDYTVIGDCVNVAARFEEMAKGGQIIIGEQTYQQTHGHFRVEVKGVARLKHKTEPIAFYEVMS